MNFMYAAELKKRFSCYGHFYELVLGRGERAKCRSVLELVDRSVSWLVPAELSELTPDAVVIMMNPGSSHPKETGYVPATIAYPQGAAAFPKDLVPTQPDNTQYQVMRIAVEQGWSHIRVLNLSDLRDPKSGSFLQTVQALGEISGGHVHSIFCPERTEECVQSLRRKKNVPILLGWGQDPGLLPLAKQCLGRIGSEPTATVPSGVHPLLNAHPSPMLQRKKLDWLGGMLQALDVAAAK